ncbi:MAG: PIN domain-containing protein [Candidatus Cloacimonetes bacterium]|nr:PIN domain-containing protein [Candidatus Cloacimonadota bacterium]
MVNIDANAILRYILNDNNEMAGKVRDLLDEFKVFVRYEVLAEVIYVLNKVYLLPRNEIVEGINIFLSEPNVETESSKVLTLALEKYAAVNIDFVDCILYSFRALYGFEVFTFDKKLISLLTSIS